MKYTTTLAQENKEQLKKAILEKSSYFFLALTWVNGPKLLQEIMDEDAHFFVEVYTTRIYGLTDQDRYMMKGYIDSLTAYLKPPQELIESLKRIWYGSLYKTEAKGYTLGADCYSTKPYSLDKPQPTAVRQKEGGFLFLNSKPLFLGLKGGSV